MLRQVRVRSLGVVVWFLGVVVAASLPCAARTAAAEDLEAHVLDNGLTVLLTPNPANPVIAVALYVTTGGRTEDEYHQGSLHYIEHLVFKGGTPHLAPTEFRKRISVLGWESGGWTWDDEINFGFEVPKANFEEAFGVFREALLELQFEKQWFESEKDVVLQEMEKGLEQPDVLVDDAWDRLAFLVHPYGRTVIGTEKAIRDLDLRETEVYYRERFTPNHMILSICGDFEPRAMLERVRATWGKLQKGPDSFELGLEEPAQLGPRSRVDYAPQATEALLLTGVVTPPGSDADQPALDLLADLLGSSLVGLPQFLIEQKKWVTAASASNYAMRDHGVFRVNAQGAPENLAAVRRFVEDFLMDFDATGLPPGLFEEVRRARVAGEIRARATAADLAERVGFLASRRGVDAAREYLARIEALTPEAVQAAKERWIVPRHLNTVTLFPDTFAAGPDTARVEPRKPRAVPVPDLHVAGGLEPSSGPGLTFTKQETDGVSVYSFENGLTLAVRPSRASRLLAVSGRVLGGQLVEPPRQAGINRFVAEMGVRSTRRWDRVGFARLADALAVSASPHVSVGSRANTSRNQDYRDAGAIHLTGLADQAPELMAILKEALFFPTFEPAAVEDLRQDLLSEVRRIPEDNLENIKQAFYVRAYAGHPYGRPTVGTEETLNAIDVPALRAFHAAAWTPDRTTIAVVGDVNPEALASLVASHWSDLPRTKAGPLVPPALTPRETAETQVLALGKEQWTLNFGRPGVGFDDARYFPSVVLGSVVGQRHFYKYVYEKAVSYRSWIKFWPNLAAGTWIVENDVQRERFDETVAEIERDLSGYAAASLPEREVRDAVQRLVVSDVLSKTANQQMAWALAVAIGDHAGVERVTRAAERYQAVSPDEVSALAREVFPPAELVRVIQK